MANHASMACSIRCSLIGMVVVELVVLLLWLNIGIDARASLKLGVA